MWRMKWEGFHLRRPRVYADRVCLPVNTGRPDDRVRLLVHASRPGDRICLLPSSITFPIPIINRGREPSSSGG
ncbi:hypothetical protein Taro_020884 [Colocasia esculenta]|uniref:Uncharacterized protein n=1 Tax=Colocasia esculenta TaxID=4460 RepID=A0A843V6J7_COLES|nr:hypothetical protein [Colocasia esculenta]